MKIKFANIMKLDQQTKLTAETSANGVFPKYALAAYYEEGEKDKDGEGCLCAETMAFAVPIIFMSGQSEIVTNCTSVCACIADFDVSVGGEGKCCYQEVLLIFFIIVGVFLPDEVNQQLFDDEDQISLSGLSVYQSRSVMFEFDRELISGMLLFDRSGVFDDEVTKKNGCENGVNSLVLKTFD
ncbi:MAG: hypothetical protein EZS28_003243 [Streblomastix strix]|uniref:Uncharacterized protein n=1 Tax=Streblomastix strix TaxID=222440 RepID=A0A5J4X227_9EUKA|nr:MAG: hypothetical protein EZS28_003243 [Streblomastix strix]